MGDGQLDVAGGVVGGDGAAGGFETLRIGLVGEGFILCEGGEDGVAVVGEIAFGGIGDGEVEDLRAFGAFFV